MFPYPYEDNLDGLLEILRQLETANGELRADQARLQADNATLQAQNAALQAQIAVLQVQIEALEQGGSTGRAGPGKPSGPKPNRPPRTEGQPRKKRAHGFARKRAVPTQRVTHALEACPACGCAVRGGTVKRTRQVFHIPLVPVQVIEHAFVERCCPQCGKRCVPRAKEVLPEVVGQHRLSKSTMALIAALREVGRLPIKTIACTCRPSTPWPSAKERSWRCCARWPNRARSG